ncbi:hypothetical protein DSL72_006850 [Monilinia vaccinii-corymbosi]|uniref:Uncharacterized protein n=1 Tax=Monilinia vaccinii-corymbosi TaxID=61207 RepID=A0A8A3PK77_9HELO|nr:hypothetical protein DSL72_006850 [Monilinia vaccinii-corymbosi]
MNQAFLTAGAEKSITFEDSIENREVLLQQIVGQVVTSPRRSFSMISTEPHSLNASTYLLLRRREDAGFYSTDGIRHHSQKSGDGLESAVNAFVMGTPATTSIANSSRHTSLADEHIHHHHNDYKAHGSYLYVDLDPESERHEMALQEMEYAVERRELALQGREEWISMDTNQAITLVSSLTTRLSSVAFRERTIQNREEALAARAEAVERREVEVGTQLAARERAISYHERGLGPMPEMPHEPVANYCAQFRVLPWSEFLSDRSPR